MLTVAAMADDDDSEGGTLREAKRPAHHRPVAGRGAPADLGGAAQRLHDQHLPGRHAACRWARGAPLGTAIDIILTLAGRRRACTCRARSRTSARTRAATSASASTTCRRTRRRRSSFTSRSWRPGARQRENQEHPARRAHKEEDVAVMRPGVLFGALFVLLAAGATRRARPLSALVAGIPARRPRLHPRPLRRRRPRPRSPTSRRCSPPRCPPTAPPTSCWSTGRRRRERLTSAPRPSSPSRPPRSRASCSTPRTIARSSRR